MTGRFEGRVALLTAAGSGIGAATAARLADEGAQVIVTDIDLATAERTAAAAVAGGGIARARKLDVTDTGGWAAVVAEVLAEHGRIDVLHLHAGLNRFGAVHELDDENWHGSMELNLFAAFYGIRACLDALQLSEGAAIVITSSIHAVQGLASAAAYATAKAGLIGLTRQVAVEYGPAMRCNAVLPGAIETAGWCSAPNDQRRLVAGVSPAARLGRPEEVAAAIAFLASDDASFITGETLLVDGGRTIKASGG